MSIAIDLIYYQVYVLIVLFLDFFLLTRRRNIIFSPNPIMLLLIGTAFQLYFSGQSHQGSSLDLGLVMMLISLCSLFAYFNLVAFIKRGVTFSILINHALPSVERTDDVNYIDLELRYDEMKDHGWINDKNSTISLTARGILVLKIYKMFVKLLGINSIG